MKFLSLSFSLLIFCGSSFSVHGVSAAKTETSAVQLPQALSSIIRTYPPLIDKALRAIKRGVELDEKGSHEAALTALPDEAASRQTDLEDYVLFYKGHANLMSNRITDAINAFQALETRHADSPLLAGAIKGEALAWLKAGNPQSALNLLAQPILQEDAEALFRRGEASENAGDYGKALEYFLMVYTDYADSEFASEARERISARFLGALTGSKGYKISLSRADSLLRAKKYREARILLLDFAKTTAPDKLSGEKRQLLLAEAEFRLGKASSALIHLKSVTNADAELHAHALYLKGICHRSLGQVDQLLNLRDEALRLHPDSAFTEQLLYSVATYFETAGGISQAQEAYREILKHFPRGAYAEPSLSRSSIISFAQKNYKACLSESLQFLINYKESRSAESAIYWIARCYEKLGDRAHALYLYRRAQALLNNSYYGQRAREAEIALRNLAAEAIQTYAGADFNQISQAVEALAVSQASFAEPVGEAAKTIGRACQLLAASLPDLAISELGWGLKGSPGNKAISYAMAYAYQTKGDRLGSILALRRAFPDYANYLPESLPREVWDLLFPKPYEDIVSSRATKNSLDPNLIFGLIRQESGFNEAALSPSNARGLMQILPGTGRSIAQKAGVTRFSTKMLYRADTNITLGTYYLNSLLKSHNGKVELALAAYNAGDSRVDHWLSALGTSDMSEFVEGIPFSETRNYIKQVLTNKAHYQLLYSAPSGTGR
jgi:soluble lytic murein transglycosylase